MFLVRATFGTDRAKRSQRKALVDTAEGYLAALLKNGQICQDYLLAWSDGRLVAYTHAAGPEWFAEGSHSQWGISGLNAVNEAFGHRPQWQVLEDNVPKRSPSWRRSSSLYLFTHAFDSASPVCCGDTGLPMPVYLLPISDQSRESIYFWARSYVHYDNIWLGSGALEMPAYKQLADTTSELAETGRKLCGEIETATKKPTFYYLHRYWGRKAGEETRPCPLCGRKWHVSAVAADKRPFHKFHFRCERCRLVSHCADSFEDERHARIGEETQRNLTN